MASTIIRESLRYGRVSAGGAACISHGAAGMRGGGERDEAGPDREGSNPAPGPAETVRKRGF